MGTTISNLQILGVPEDTVRAAVPYALVGAWSERFVTVCPSLAVLARLDRPDDFCSPKTACGCPAKASSSATTRSRPSSPATGLPETSAASISPKMEISARSPSKTGGICFGSIVSLDLRAGTLTS